MKYIYIIHIYLYKGTELVEKVPSTNYVLTELESNTKYKIVAEYGYDLDDGVGPQTLIEEYEFTTLKQNPTISFGDYDVNENSIKVNPIIVDKDASGRLTKVELYLNQELVETSTTNYLFTNLLSDTTYEVRCYYSYDVNLGETEMVVTNEVTTDKNIPPRVDIELNSENNTISYNVLASTALIDHVELIKMELLLLLQMS
jgi:hypothetical protein